MSRAPRAAKSHDSLALTLGLSLAMIAASCSLLTPTGDLTGGEPSAPPSADASIDAPLEDQSTDHTDEQGFPASCGDRKLDDGETDIDCGGSCAPCGNAMKCALSTDCLSGHCAAKVCQAATCTDKIRNGLETGVDCGGGTCPACSIGQPCSTQSDCETLLCKGDSCALGSCTDKQKDDGESDVDCGGPSCPKCGNGSICKADTDCQEAVCATPDVTLTTLRCQPCADKMKDGSETDVDCGGVCKPCGGGLACGLPGDCASNDCEAGKCKAACGAACAVATDCVATCPCDLTKKICSM